MTSISWKPPDDGFTAESLTAALGSLGLGLVADPEHRSDGLTEEDVPRLLGSLGALADSGLVEQARAGRTDGYEDGYADTAGENARMMLRMLHCRVGYVAIQLRRLEADSPQLPGVLRDGPLLTAAQHALFGAAACIDSAVKAGDEAEGNRVPDLDEVEESRKQARECLEKALRNLEEA